MKATSLYRTAAVILVVFAAGHTAGFLTFKPASPEGLAVLGAMKNVHFGFGSTTGSYLMFYTGFGLMISAEMLFSAFLSWHLGRLAAKQPEAIGSLGWAFFALQVAGLALCWIYFSAIQAVLSAAAAVCVGLAAWRVRTASLRFAPEPSAAR